MKLSEKDKTILASLGCPEEDFDQIKYAADQTSFTLGDQDGNMKRISIKTANQLLTREVFLSGLNRSAFHFSAVREAVDGQLIYFDSSAYFKD